ncbi:hypothetical protein B0H12DRAFT_444696 [Mycena haematopus]|nr:hypothetical protein B0H12DRAFT_444696 [Mycena haematopus]
MGAVEGKGVEAEGRDVKWKWKREDGGWTRKGRRGKAGGRRETVVRRWLHKRACGGPHCPYRMSGSCLANFFTTLGVCVDKRPMRIDCPSSLPHPRLHQSSGGADASARPPPGCRQGWGWVHRGGLGGTRREGWEPELSPLNVSVPSLVSECSADKTQDQDEGRDKDEDGMGRKARAPVSVRPHRHLHRLFVTRVRVLPSLRVPSPPPMLPPRPYHPLRPR